MKIECGKRRRLKQEAEQRELEKKQEWHKFFAIYPRKVGVEDCRYMETIERKLMKYEYNDYFFGVAIPAWKYVWAYRALDK